MKQEHTLQPKLRFPDFEEDWGLLRLLDVLTRSSESNKDGEFKLDDILSLSSHHGIVKRRDILEDVYSDVNYLNYKKTRLNDLVYGKSISSSYPFGLFKVNNCGDGLLSTLYYTFVVKDCLLPNFIDYYFDYNTRVNNFLRKAVFLGDRYITADINKLMKGEIVIATNKLEQQKIADYLSTIDTKINLLEEKKEQLTQYKKGMMQKLFSQEIRFKPVLNSAEGNENAFPEWQNSFGGDIFISHTNKNHNSDLDVLAITQEHGAIPRNLIDYKVQVSNESVNNYKVVKKDDFIISLRSFQGGIEHSNYIGICSPAYIILRNIKPIEPLFYKAFFKSRNYINYLNRTLEGIRDGKMISYTNFAKSKLPYPSLPEQQKIADFLSAIDESIDKVTEQISQTQSFKKAMLQQMFV